MPYYEPMFDYEWEEAADRMERAWRIVVKVLVLTLLFVLLSWI